MGKTIYAKDVEKLKTMTHGERKTQKLKELGILIIKNADYIVLLVLSVWLMAGMPTTL